MTIKILELVGESNNSWEKGATGSIRCVKNNRKYCRG